MNTLSVIEQHNLYINSEKYKTDYNFYNYNKFRIQKILPITYRSPTIFLDGLYFELSRSQILSINKKSDSMIYELVVSVNIPSVQGENIINTLSQINAYNIDFFEQNKEKFVLKITKSNKRNFYRNDKSENYKLETKFKPPLKNPLIKSYKYTPFYNLYNNKGDSSNNYFITIPLMIKHNYLLRIIELILLDIDNNDLITDEYKAKIQELHSLLVDTEYFELKRNELNIDLSMINLMIKFWIKSNNFFGDEKTELIHMLWYICDYKY